MASWPEQGVTSAPFELLRPFAGARGLGRRIRDDHQPKHAYERFDGRCHLRQTDLENPTSKLARRPVSWASTSGTEFSV